MYCLKPVSPLILAVTLVTAVGACGQGNTKFSNASVKPIPSTAPGESAGGEKFGREGEKAAAVEKLVLPYVAETCTEEYRAMRVAFVVDNTGSNSCERYRGKIQDGSGGYCGTDPVRGSSPRNDGEGYTERQNAIYEAILNIAANDQKAIEKNANFPGTDVGIISFPQDANSLSKFKEISGNNSILPGLMTNVKDLKVTDDFKTKLWSLLKFTHSPDGATPYKTALEGAIRLLKENRAASETRSDIVFFITDGLPTDEQPSKVKEVRAKLGKETPVIFFSIYSPGKNTEQQNAPAKESLRQAWSNPQLEWGHRAGVNDGFAGFDQYWSALLGLPKEISDAFIEVSDPMKLKTEINQALGVLRTCKQGEVK